MASNEDQWITVGDGNASQEMADELKRCYTIGINEEDPQSLRSCEELVEALRAEISRASEDDGKGRRCLVSADLLAEVAYALDLYGVHGGADAPWCADCHKFGANCTCGVECPNCQEWKDDCICGFDPDEDEDDDWEDDDEDDWDEEEDEDEA